MNGEILSETFLTPELPYYKDVSGCIRQIDLLCSAQTEGYQLAVKGLALSVLLSARLQPAEKRGPHPASQMKSLEKMKTILKYVEDHYAGHITIEDMAELTCYSKSHFMKFFNRTSGPDLSTTSTTTGSPWQTAC